VILVALSTSLPELAASVSSAYHKEPELSIANVIGSNNFNLLFTEERFIDRNHLHNQAFERQFLNMHTLKQTALIKLYKKHIPNYNTSIKKQTLQNFHGEPASWENAKSVTLAHL
jgi:hypothetical protein